MSSLWRAILFVHERAAVDSELYVYCILGILAVTVVVDDPLPFLGEVGASRWFKISPLVCGYDIVWQLTGQVLAWSERESAELGGRHVAAPDGPDGDLQPASRLKLALEFASFVQAAQLSRRPDMPWCQTFVACYALHWAMVNALRMHGVSRVPEQALSVAQKETRHLITRMAFYLICQALLCYLSLAQLNNPGLNQFIVIGTAAMLAYGWMDRGEEMEAFWKYFVLAGYTYFHLFLFILLRRTYAWPVEKPLDALRAGFIVFDALCMLTGTLLAMTSFYPRPVVWLSSICIMLLFFLMYVVIGSSIRF